MQPYFFPYIGYFQLINSADKFVFYDDVNFIKNGWINRNRILLNGESHYLTVQLKNASSYKLISETEFSDNRKKLLKTIEHAYKKSPNFHLVFPLVNDVLNFPTDNVSVLSIYSVETTSKFLNLSTEFYRSSISYPDTNTFKRSERLISICIKSGASYYINPYGGLELYEKEDFDKYGIKLGFLKSREVTYKQYDQGFVPWLSIIDVMMFNSIEKISNMLNNFDIK